MQVGGEPMNILKSLATVFIIVLVSGCYHSSNGRSSHAYGNYQYSNAKHYSNAYGHRSSYRGRGHSINRYHHSKRAYPRHYRSKSHLSVGNRHGFRSGYRHGFRSSFRGGHRSSNRLHHKKRSYYGAKQYRQFRSR